MPEFHIGRYTYSVRTNFYINLNLNGQSGKDDIVESYDQVLHQWLEKIFREQIRDFLGDLQCDTNIKSIIRPILEQEPALSGYFSKEELGKLPLLWIAVLAGYEKSAELLVRSGANVNELFGRHDPKVINEKWTVLHVLIQMPSTPENERLIRLVVDQGADLQVRDFWGRTVLYYAVEKGRVQMTEMLLDKGADVNAADNNGITPLLVAVGNRNAIELVPLLIKHGADVFVKICSGMNILHKLALHNPEENGTIELARIFIEMGVSLDDKSLDCQQHQPIHLATVKGNVELVKLFLAHGANVNALKEYDESPLYLAVVYERPKVLENLIKHGANVNQKTSRGITTLHVACQLASGSDVMESMIRLLLSAGADVLAEDPSGRTPLNLLSSHGNVQGPKTKLLIKALVLKKVLQPSVELKDERIIKRYQKLQDYYREFIQEIDKMRITRFIHTCSFFELLAKSHYQIAELMRNPEFEIKFRQYDLTKFPNYCENILRAYEHAQKQYPVMLEQENVIDEAFYNILPYMFVRKVLHYIFND